VRWLGLLVLASSASAFAKTPKKIWKPSSRYELPAHADEMPAFHYSSMTQDECVAELKARDIPYAEETARGVDQPVRLTGPLHGVTFRTDESAAKRESSPYEIADCRLVLALDDFAQILEKHDVVEVRHYSMYRPPGKSLP